MSSPPLASLEAIVYGRVQGVYFRQTTYKEAQRLDLAGWVGNRADGTVQVVAEGPEPALRRLLAFLQVGPPAARVERVESQWTTAAATFTEFRVRSL